MTRRLLPGHDLLVLLLAGVLAGVGCAARVRGAERGDAAPASGMSLDWQALPELPDELGVAGPFVGVHSGVLIVAGGANFPRPVWEQAKVWRDEIFVLRPTPAGPEWTRGGVLPRPVAYGAAVSTELGVVCLGGNDAQETFRDVFVLRWDATAGTVTRVEFPPLPAPCAYGQAVQIGESIYLAGGQSGTDLSTAMRNLWRLELSTQDDPAVSVWRELPPCPGAARAFNITARQHNGYEECLYVLSGRAPAGKDIQFLTDMWEFTPQTSAWRRRADVPRCVMGGTGIGFGQSHLFVLGGDDGARFHQTDELQDRHPGFPRESLAYHTITDTWTSAGTSPQNQVTTIPVLWNGRMVVASGEVRPRVRTPSVWSVAPVPVRSRFRGVDYVVLVGYLGGMVAIGAWFTRRNRSTEDYFRGGQHVPWWAAGCSIFATMLSSLTYTGLPAKAFAQDWVYALGNFMIPVVAIVAVFVALPFYRRIDATSAYEFLERRFSRGVRWFGSASFALFHLFRMAIVMSLTALAMSVATPLSPAQSVLLMGVLSVLYCTLGGVEAVIWTDTAQTVVLLGGALIALWLLVAGTEGGLSGTLETAWAADKFRMANHHMDMTSARLALWVVVVGAIGQFIPSYTADQAVVQRYMTTADERLAARAIWTNAVLSVPATLLFFGIGTGLYAFYRSHPDRLDPLITTDQIFPLFIASEAPAGLAGLIVAGVFAAAQSTVSTSINSTATTVVTDFLRPLRCCRTEAGYLRWARLVSGLSGILGTLLGLAFIDPGIRSLFDAFMQVIGLFMGVLGGLFVLGVLTRRANALGAMTGALIGALVMYLMWRYSRIHGYLYTAIGISTCVTVGYLASLMSGGQDRDVTGLTLASGGGGGASNRPEPVAPA
jgi:SSS family transporter